jgi:hypothetical protein
MPGITKDFIVYLGLQVNQGASINGTANVATALVVGNSTVNVSVNTTTLAVGNSTVNSQINSSAVAARSLVANGSVGATGDVLFSNGTGLYWSAIPGNTIFSPTVSYTWTAVQTYNANLFMNTSVLSVGNSTVNVTANTTHLVIGNTTANVFANTTHLVIGNSTVNVSINSTAFSGTANNSTNLNGVAAASYVNTSGAYIITGVHTHNANLFMNTSVLIIGNTTANIVANTTHLVIGNSTVNVSTNSTVFSGTANNSTNFNGQAAAFYANATNLTSGTLPFARLPANSVFWSNTNVFTAIQTFNANLFVNTSVLSVGNTTANVFANTTHLFVGNSTVSVTVNSTAFTGTANNTTNLGGVAAASYVQNTDSRTLSGNLTIAGTNTVITSNVFATGSLIQLGNTTANSLTITATGNVGIKNTAPASTFHINGNYTTSQTNIGTINSTSNNTISLATGNYFRGTVGGAVTLSFTNFPANCTTGFIFAFANVGTNVTWPAAVKWAGGTAPTFSSNTDIITLITHDAGTTIYGALSIKDAR